MKFKVGDKVRVRKDLLKNQQLGDKIFVEDMTMFIGKIVTIKEVCDGFYKIKEDDRWWHWTDGMFESKIMNFTKSDLKDGMVVELLNGKRLMFLDEVFLGSTDELSKSEVKPRIELGDFNDDFEYKYFDDSYAIDKVYCSSSISLSSYFDDENLKLIWERNQVKKMTIAEIEKELGYKIEIVADKEE